MIFRETLISLTRHSPFFYQELPAYRYETVHIQTNQPHCASPQTGSAMHHMQRSRPVYRFPESQGESAQAVFSFSASTDSAVLISAYSRGRQTP